MGVGRHQQGRDQRICRQYLGKYHHFTLARSCYAAIMDAKSTEPTRPVVDLQTQLAKAYMSGNGAEVERVLTLIAEAKIVLPPKSRAAA